MYEFKASDNSTQAINPIAGLLGGGFAFGTQKIYGGAGNSQDNTATPTATLSPTAPAVPFADGLLGFGGGAAGSVSPGVSSLILPMALLGAALLIAVALRRK